MLDRLDEFLGDNQLLYLVAVLVLVLLLLISSILQLPSFQLAFAGKIGYKGHFYSKGSSISEVIILGSITTNFSVFRAT